MFGTLYVIFNQYFTTISIILMLLLGSCIRGISVPIPIKQQTTSETREHGNCVMILVLWAAAAGTIQLFTWQTSMLKVKIVATQWLSSSESLPRYNQADH
jgi:hypothetical protein